jgi:putative NADPH-quinone reductase
VLAKTAENAVSQFIKKDLKNANFNPAATVPSAEPNLKQEAEKRLANYLSI